jgi:hypothetical protein
LKLATRRTTGMTGHLGFRLALPFAVFLGIAEVVRKPIDQRPLTLIIGILFGVTVLGFASSLSAHHIGPSPTSGARGGAEASSE